MTTNEHVDVLVIGGGPGGTPAALALGQGGAGVSCSSRRAAGSAQPACSRAASHPRCSVIRRRDGTSCAGPGEFGLRARGSDVPGVDWPAVQADAPASYHRAQGAQAHTMPDCPGPRPRVRSGTPHRPPHQPSIEAAEGPPRGPFDRAVLATGSIPTSLEIPGAELPGVLDSTGLIEIVPYHSSLVRIGGGPVGVEMAQIFPLLGTRVTILEACHQSPTRWDCALADLLATRTPRRDGLGWGRGVRSRPARESGRRGTYLPSTVTVMTAQTQVVAIAAGRRPNIDGLGLETTTVRHDSHGVAVDAALRPTSPAISPPAISRQPDVRALGHGSGLRWRPPVGPARAFPRPEPNSAAIFSSPESAWPVCPSRPPMPPGLDVGVAEYDYPVDARAQIADNPFGRVRLVYLGDYHRVSASTSWSRGRPTSWARRPSRCRRGTPVEAMARGHPPAPHAR